MMTTRNDDTLYRIDLSGSFAPGARDSWRGTFAEAILEDLLVPAEPVGVVIEGDDDDPVATFTDRISATDWDGLWGSLPKGRFAIVRIGDA
jgi:hypothetical protein